MNRLVFTVSNDYHLTIEYNKTNLFIWICLFYFAQLRLNGTKNALFSRNVSFIMIMSARKVQKLSLITRLHKLSQHFHLLFTHTVF